LKKKPKPLGIFDDFPVYLSFYYSLFHTGSLDMSLLLSIGWCKDSSNSPIRSVQRLQQSQASERFLRVSLQRAMEILLPAQSCSLSRSCSAALHCADTSLAEN